MVQFGGGHQRLIEHRSSDVRGSNKSFSALNFKPWLTEALQKNGYKFQAKVQEATLPTVLTGHDVIIQVKILDITETFGLNFGENNEHEIKIKKFWIHILDKSFF